MTVVANIIGQKPDGKIWVNVKNANPQGMIGDAGVIRQFNTQEEAQAYANAVNQTGEDVFVPQDKQEKQEPLQLRHAGDTFEKTN